MLDIRYCIVKYYIFILQLICLIFLFSYFRSIVPKGNNFRRVVDDVTRPPSKRYHCTVTNNYILWQLEEKRRLKEENENKERQENELWEQRIKQQQEQQAQEYQDEINKRKMKEVLRNKY